MPHAYKEAALQSRRSGGARARVPPLRTRRHTRPEKQTQEALRTRLYARPEKHPTTKQEKPKDWRAQRRNLQVKYTAQVGPPQCHTRTEKQPSKAEGVVGPAPECHHCEQDDTNAQRSNPEAGEATKYTAPAGATPREATLQSRRSGGARARVANKTTHTPREATPRSTANKTLRTPREAPTKQEKPKRLARAAPKFAS